MLHLWLDVLVRLQGTDSGISIDQNSLSTIRKRLESSLDSPVPAEYDALTAEEKKIVQRIRTITARHNADNVTRTAAYWSIYRTFPELHWAMLAHMVSRNGGWNMTDLKGEYLPHLLGEREQNHTFCFLETANANIFRDAFPQLILYQESRRLGRSLFHLLPYFQVSRFMRPFWEHFWHTRNSPLITVALIINEQNVIEKTVIQNDWFHQHVFDKLFFRSLMLLQLNQVILPYDDPRKKTCRLAGLTLEQFVDLKERIETGKTLYAILFGRRGIKQKAERFASRCPHTGSRADFWPHRFSPEPPFHSGYLSRRKRIYSPTLQVAWGRVTTPVTNRLDWFRDESPFRHFTEPRQPRISRMNRKFHAGLKRLDWAARAASTVKNETHSPSTNRS